MITELLEQLLLLAKRLTGEKCGCKAIPRLDSLYPDSQLVVSSACIPHVAELVPSHRRHFLTGLSQTRGGDFLLPIEISPMPLIIYCSAILLGQVPK